MCGRYVRRGDKQKIAEHFRAQPNPAELPMPDADYNVAPTTHQPIIRQSRETGERADPGPLGLSAVLHKGSEGHQGPLDHQCAIGVDHQITDLARAFRAPDKSPTEVIETFRKFYGPTMNAFEAADKNGKTDELNSLLIPLAEAQNTKVGGGTQIPVKV